MRNSIPFLLLCIIFSDCSSKKEVKLKQYISNGEALYATHCANCHQSDGTGLGKLIPPVNNEFASKNKALTICAIRNGLEGPLEIDGVKFNGKMPGNVKLSSLEIAEIITYITNKWGNQEGITDYNQVESLLNQCAD